MRTPGADRELALGFLYAEGVIRSLDDVGSVAHCGHPGEEGFGNVIDVLPGAGVVLAPERVAGTRRGTLTAAACGVCGRLTIDDLIARCAPVADDARIEATALARFIRSMRDRQALFARTGGVHAAALFAAAGTGDAPLFVREDVGRHNAVDKLVGALIFARALPGRWSRADRQWPHQLRDRAEGGGRGHPDRRQRVGAKLAGNRSRGAHERHAGRVPARRVDERLQRAGAHRRPSHLTRSV